jgi:putative transposase
MPLRAYRRNLPHIFPRHTPIFITWRLRGSIPAVVARQSGKSENLTAGEKFVSIDRQLDGCSSGRRWLADQRIAEVMCVEIERGAEEPLFEYALHGYVVMPNHVHLFITPYFPVSEIMHRLKGNTARFANEILGRDATTFWQQESYDHFSRNVREFERIRGYMRGIR